tara:strand:+ start:1242 stop:2156 length:915 start_codon:yes stop_codon:yes gene_type:complete
MGFVRHLTGKTAARGAERAGDIQSAQATDNAAQLAQVGVDNQARLQGAQTNQLAELRSGAYGANNILGQAGQEASGLFDPFAQIGQQGVEQAGFATDPNAQFDFLQNNPLFQMGLDNANTQTNQMAAARGRLSAGDTLQQLNQNALLTASPLIQQQKQAIQNQLTMGQNAANQQANIGQNTAVNQAKITSTLGGQRADVFGNTAINQSNLAAGNQANVGNMLGSAAAAQAAGIVGAANAKGAGASNILGIGAQLAGSFMPSFGGGPGAVPPPSMPGGGGFGSNLNLSSQPVFDSSAWGTYPGGT